MQAIPSTIHKYFKFPHNGQIITINHSLYQPTSRRGNFTLDYFWPQQPKPLKPQAYILFLSYKKWKHEMISALSIPKYHSPMDIPPLHPEQTFLPTPSIPPLYAMVPIPTSYLKERAQHIVSLNPVRLLLCLPYKGRKQAYVD